MDSQHGGLHGASTSGALRAHGEKTCQIRPPKIEVLGFAEEFWQRNSAGKILLVKICRRSVAECSSTFMLAMPRKFEVPVKR